MTAPRPEAVELARAIVRAVTFDEYDEDVWNATDLIDAAITAARADAERVALERACKAVCPWCAISDKPVSIDGTLVHRIKLLRFPLPCSAAPIRDMEGR